MGFHIFPSYNVACQEVHYFQVFPSKHAIQIFLLLFLTNVKHTKFHCESLHLSYALAYLFKRWQGYSVNLLPVLPRIIKNVLLCMFHMTVRCVIMFAVFKQLTRAALQQVCSLGNDITTGLSVSVFCAGTNLKWMEWEGEIVGRIVLLLWRRKHNI